MTLYLIILIGVVGQLGYNGSKISVSLYALELGADQFTVGVLIAIYAVLPMLLAIFVGRFVDRVGPRLPVILGIAGMGLALLLPPLFPGIAVLYVSCSLIGLAELLFLIPIESSIGGIGGAGNRAANYSLLSMGWASATFIGPIVAGFAIDHIGHVQVFWLLASFYVLPMLAFCFRPGLLPGIVKHADHARHGSVLELWRMPKLRTVLITGAVLNSAQNLFSFYFPIYGHTLGLSASVIGTILGVVAVAAFVIRSILPLLTRKRTEAEILGYAFFVAAFAFTLYPFVSDPYALAAITFLFGLGSGCCKPLSMSLIYALTPPGRIAESMGLFRSVMNVTHLAIPLVFGSVGAAFGYATVFLSNATMLLGSGLLVRKTRLPVADLHPK